MAGMSRPVLAPGGGDFLDQPEVIGVSGIVDAHPTLAAGDVQAVGNIIVLDLVGAKEAGGRPTTAPVPD